MPNTGREKKPFRDFPGGPMAKTPCSHCRQPRFDPWSGNQAVTCRNWVHMPHRISKTQHAATKTWYSQVNKYFKKKKPSLALCLRPSPCSYSPLAHTGLVHESNLPCTLGKQRTLSRPLPQVWAHWQCGLCTGEWAQGNVVLRSLRQAVTELQVPEAWRWGSKWACLHCHVDSSPHVEGKARPGPNQALSRRGLGAGSHLWEWLLQRSPSSHPGLLTIFSI